MSKALRNRLQLEYEELLDLQSRVALDESGKSMIEIEPIEVVRGFPPEKYIVTYRCKSIIGVKEGTRPIFGYEHQIEIHLRQDFLRIGPALSGKTPFWHPNIDHKEPYHICLDLPNFVDPTTPIYLVILRIGELIQYKKYHAELLVFPYPQDEDAAKWVKKYAEPNGIIGKNKPIDDRNLLSEMINIWSNNQEDNSGIIIWDSAFNTKEETNNTIEELSDDLGISIGGIKEFRQSD